MDISELSQHPRPAAVDVPTSEHAAALLLSRGDENKINFEIDSIWTIFT